MPMEYDENFLQLCSAAAQGRNMKTIDLYKPEGSSLGFSVVGLKSEHKGELGIYVQEVQPHGIAAQHGQLLEGDQILAIDGKRLDSNISHQQAISILQRAKGTVHLVVARNKEEMPKSEPPKDVAKPSTDFGFPSDWCQVEVIELVNNGQGLGFGIIGGKQPGVIVKTILPDGVASVDGRLRASDFILKINEHWLQGVNSEQVAKVLRGTGNHVKLVVARSVDPGNPSQARPNIPILPSSMLNNQKELETHLQIAAVAAASPAHAAPFGPSTNLAKDMILPTQAQEVSITHKPSKSFDQTQASSGVSVPLTTPVVHEMPEMETLDVELVKDAQGLGITIAGYTCEREELSGIFVKSVTEGSSAFRSGKVAVNDQIVEVDGNSIQGYTNQQAVEMLRSTGKTVKLKLVRYVHGLKFEQLQQAIANSQSNSQVTTPSKAGSPLHTITKAPEVKQETKAVTHSQPAPTAANVMIRTDSVVSKDDTDKAAESVEADSDYEGELSETKEQKLIVKWSEIMGPTFQIIVAQLAKFKQNGGLGISLEGTVEKVDGEEQNPHHYIRSVLANGPVGKNGKLQSGDELLEVNGRKLLGLYHTDVVGILKELPMNVRIVCARSKSHSASVNTKQDFPLGGGVRQQLQGMSASERMVKAKSDGSISSTGTTTEISQQPQQNSKLKSRSLEPLTNLAMWSEEVLNIDLVKGERGLGFSILDYQDPMNKEETVIVIRSLVPGGVAQQDGQLIPGDRLMYVNEVNLAHASLDDAVQALKGAQRGIVRIGVSKPLPLPDSSGAEDSQAEEESHTRSSVSDITEIRSELSGPNTPEHQAGLSSLPELPPDDAIPPPLPTSPPPPENDFLTQNERLIGGHSSTVVTTRVEPKTDDAIPPLPAALERHIRLVKDSDTLGVQVDIEEEGINGLVVRSITPGGTLARDQRIQPGDYLVGVNGETMRKISHSQALDILRRTHMIPLQQEISMTYIPASDAAVYKTSAITRLNTALTEPELKKAESPKVDDAQNSSSSSSSSEKGSPRTSVSEKANGTTVISIGEHPILAESSQEKKEEKLFSAPLVSPERSEIFADKTSPQFPDFPVDSANSLALQEATVDESSTDYDQQPLPSPPPPLEFPVVPPRPSKSSSLASTPSHSLSSAPKDEKDESSSSRTASDRAEGTDIGGSRVTSSAAFCGQQWGPERIVKIKRIPNQGLGISIVGGKVEASSANDSSLSVSGIFIKNVLEGSPAGISGQLSTGDRILEVDGHDLRNSSHDEAVDVIRQSGDIVVFVVQSLQGMSASESATSDSEDDDDDEECSSSPSAISDSFPPAPPPPIDEKDELVEAPPGFANEPSTSDESTPSNDEQFPEHDQLAKRRSIEGGETTTDESVSWELSGQITLPNGNVIDRDSAGFLPKSKKDQDEEDEYNYTLMKIQRKYAKFSHQPDGSRGTLLYVSLNKGSNGLGISLAGHKDRSKMSVYICGLNPQGNAFRDGRMKIGDLLLEVNGSVIHRRHHLNVSSLVKSLPDSDVTFVLLRTDNGMENLAVKPLSQFPPEPFKDNPIERYRGKYKGLREVNIHKGDQGLGIMIIEGKHSEAGTGVFVSDLQPGSCADEAGIQRGNSSCIY